MALTWSPSAPTRQHLKISTVLLDRHLTPVLPILVLTWTLASVMLTWTVASTGAQCWAWPRAVRVSWILSTTTLSRQKHGQIQQILPPLCLEVSNSIRRRWQTSLRRQFQHCSRNRQDRHHLFCQSIVPQPLPSPVPPPQPTQSMVPHVITLMTLVGSSVPMMSSKPFPMTRTSLLSQDHNLRYNLWVRNLFSSQAVSKSNWYKPWSELSIKLWYSHAKKQIKTDKTTVQTKNVWIRALPLTHTQKQKWEQILPLDCATVAADYCDRSRRKRSFKTTHKDNKERKTTTEILPFYLKKRREKEEQKISRNQMIPTPPYLCSAKINLYICLYLTKSSSAYV